MKRRLYIEAGIVGFILLALLTFTFPKFLLAQKYGPIRPQDCRDISGQWEWIDGELHQTSDKPNTMILFDRDFDSGEISFQVMTQNGVEGVRVIYGFDDFRNYHTWEIGGWNNTLSCLNRNYPFTTIKLRLYQNMIPRPVTRRSRGIIPPTPFTLTTNVWHEVRLVVKQDSQTIEGFVDGKSILSYAHSSPIVGRFGLGTHETKISVRNLEISSTSK